MPVPGTEPGADTVAPGAIDGPQIKYLYVWTIVLSPVPNNGASSSREDQAVIDTEIADRLPS